MIELQKKEYNELLKNYRLKFLEVFNDFKIKNIFRLHTLKKDLDNITVLKNEDKEKIFFDFYYFCKQRNINFERNISDKGNILFHPSDYYKNSLFLDYAARFFGYNFSYILELIINDFLKNNERMINLFSLPDLDDEQMDIEIFYFANYYYDIQKLKVEHFYEILEITKNELDRELNYLLNFQKNIYECEEEYKRITNR